MTRCQCNGELHTHFGHWWQRMSARHLVIEVTYFHGDDKTETSREYEISVPDWIYRPRCWLKGHETDGYRTCVFCRKALR
jgi:hypothetical protein